MRHLALFIAVLLPCFAFAGPQIYTSDSGTGDISRLTQQGTAREVLLENYLSPFFIEVDEAGGKVYWGATARVMRANLDGSNVEVLFDQSDGLRFVGGIAIDVTGSRLFLVDYIQGAILRGSLDGSGVLTTVFDASNSVFAPQDIEFDPVGQRLYWSTFSGLQSGNADGSGMIQSLYPAIGPGVIGIALDVAAGRIFWVDGAASSIYRGNMNGSGSPLLLFDGSEGVFAPWGIAVDKVSNQVIWTNGNGQIRRGSITGVGATQLVYSGVVQGYGIAHAPSAAALFVLSRSNVLSGPKTGGTLSTVVDFTGRDASVSDLVPDLASNFLYMADGGRSPKIVRVALDFGDPRVPVNPSSIQTLYSEIHNIGSPRGIALHRATGFLYWANDLAMIQRGSLDGSAPVETLFTIGDGLFNPYSLVVSPAGDFVFWADRSTKKVSRGNADGSGAPTDLFGQPDGLMQPVGLDIDFAAGKIYWSDFTAKKIQRGNIDGGGAPEDLFTSADGVGSPDRVKLSISEGKIYWLEGNSLKRGAMDGIGVIESFPIGGAVAFSGMTLVYDTDEDGVPDEIDQCAIDPNKTLPAACGCGTPDLDLNQNGIFDCLVSQDLKERLNALRGAVQSLKRKSSRSLRTSVKSLGAEIGGVLTNDIGAIQTQATTAQLKKWGIQIRTQATRATRVKSEDLRKRKRQVLRSIERVLGKL